MTRMSHNSMKRLSRLLYTCVCTLVWALCVFGVVPCVAAARADTPADSARTTAVATPTIHSVQPINLQLTSADIHNDLRSILSHLRGYTFYRIFAVNLYSDCMYWSDAHQCAEIGCAVCGECSADELPVEWTTEVAAHNSQVNDTLSAAIETWSDTERYLWIYQDNSTVHDIKYIDISYNPEGYTGYVGEPAHKIWSAIYLENCFLTTNTDATDAQCYERKVFYKLISGMHSTISAHIAWNWPQNTPYNIHTHAPQHTAFNTPVQHTPFTLVGAAEAPAAVSPNVDVYLDKLAVHRDRIENLRFTYTVLLRAVNKATDTLLRYEYITGNRSEESAVKQSMQQLLSSAAVQQCTQDVSFDETTMFAGENSQQLKQEFQQHFRNVSAIIDCVGCEKCRLHGKLQVLGIGTALRILFGQQVVLQRNEIMSLIVTLSKVADALYYVQQMHNMATNHKTVHAVHRTQPVASVPHLATSASPSSHQSLLASHTHADIQSLHTAVLLSFTSLSILVACLYIRQR